MRWPWPRSKPGRARPRDPATVDQGVSIGHGVAGGCDARRGVRVTCSDRHRVSRGRGVACRRAVSGRDRIDGRNAARFGGARDIVGSREAVGLRGIVGRYIVAVHRAGRDFARAIRRFDRAHGCAVRRAARRRRSGEFARLLRRRHRERSGGVRKGLRTREPVNRRATGASTVFDAASISKQFTAASILLLAEDHRLSLDDDAQIHVPELRQIKVHLPLRLLLYHTDGLPPVFDVFSNAGFSPYQSTADDLPAALAQITSLSFSPGTQYFYTDTGYDVLRLIVERVSGLSFDAFTKQRIFDPLGMTATFFSRTPMQAFPNKATAYGQGSSSSMPWLPEDVNLAFDLGGAGLQTTVADLLRWATNFDTGRVGGPTFLQAQLVVSPIDVNDYTFPTKYMAGLFLWQQHGHRLIFHSGAASDSAFRSQLTIDPVHHVAVAVGCNTNAVRAYIIGFQAMGAWLGDPGAIPPLP